MNFDNISLRPTADFHVHLREGAIMEAVVPLIREGGVDTVYVMVGRSLQFYPRHSSALSLSHYLSGSIFQNGWH